MMIFDSLKTKKEHLQLQWYLFENSDRGRVVFFTNLDSNYLSNQLSILCDHLNLALNTESLFYQKFWLAHMYHKKVD